MTDSQSQNNEIPFFTADEFLKSELNTTLDSFKDLNLRNVQSTIEPIIDSFEENSKNWRVLRFFLIICSVHFDVEKPEIYSPMMILGNRTRTVIPSDISPQQWDEIEKILGQIRCPLLRAVLADMIWIDNKSKWKLPDIACKSFCEVIESYLAGKINDDYSPVEFVSNTALDLLERSIQILRGSGQKKVLPEFISQAWHGLWIASIKRKHAFAFVRLADIGLTNELINHSSVAEISEEILTGSPQSYPMAEKRVWELAAHCYEKLKDHENKERCLLNTVTQTLRMRDSVSQSMAKASWTRDAIQELRQIGGQKEKIKTLRYELLEYQDAALDELAHFSVPLDIKAQVEGTRKAFSGKSLSEMLKYFCIIAKPVDIKDLKSSVIETAKTSPLSAMMGMSRTDREGRIISSFSGAPIDAPPDDNWIKNQSLQHLDIYFQQVVGGCIYPAIKIICAQEAVYERYFYAIAERSPFIPMGFREIYAKGFWMMFQGDFIGAAYILFPMLENSIRYVLSITNQDSSKMLPDSTQEDRSLSGLLENMREELESIFGANTTNEIDLLFNFKGGPSLRHEVAHGKLTSGDCFHHSAIYGCWTIYRLACTPMFRTWDESITPTLDSLK